MLWQVLRKGRQSLLSKAKVERLIAAQGAVVKISSRPAPASVQVSSARYYTSSRATSAVAEMATSKHGGYAEAIAALNTLQSNAAVIEAIRKSGGKLNDFALPEMIEYLERIGWTQEDLNTLNVIHITGTKGKGSTSAFVDALVRRAGSTNSGSKSKGPSVGLYTSPHLVQVRERIRLDGVPISEELFAQYFWDVWDRLGANQQRKNPEMTPVRPVYFRYLTILAYHVFLSLKVRCTILEVGIGGRFDSTNIVPRPVVTGITTLGLDHTALLGNTIEEIAGQKAGIFKKGVPAISVWQQSEGARKVIEDEARKVGTSSYTLLPNVTSNSEYRKVELGIPGAHQASNAQLAVEMCRAFEKTQAGQNFESASSSAEALSEDEKIALQAARWPGRCQIVRGGKAATETCWFLDGAHTTESLESCAKWFVQASTSEAQKGDATKSPRARKTLIFNTTHDRKSEELLRGMIEAMQASATGAESVLFDEIIFSTNITYREGKSAGDLTSVAGPVSLEPQQNMQKAWQALDPNGRTKTQALASIEEAVDAIKEQDNHAGPQHVLVTGSLHLVGGVMSHLKDAHLLDESLNGIF